MKKDDATGIPQTASYQLKKSRAQLLPFIRTKQPTRSRLQNNLTTHLILPTYQPIQPRRKSQGSLARLDLHDRICALGVAARQQIRPVEDLTIHIVAGPGIRVASPV